MLKHLNIVDDFKMDLIIRDTVDAEKSGIIITVDATHGGYVNRNYYNYSPASMREAVDSWIKPFPKPLLINHDKNSKPLGRVVDSRYIGDDKYGFIQLDILVTDEEAIKMVKDKRYLTVSTSGDPVEYVKCSVCGQDHMNSDTYCGHKRGKVYTDEETEVSQLCFWHIGRLRYSEVSFVNKPADNDGDETAAIVVSWKFQDEEGDVPTNNEDTQKHEGNVFMSKSVWTPQTAEDKQKVVKMLQKGAQIVANQSLFDSIKEENPIKAIDAYIAAGGQFSGDLQTTHKFSDEEQKFMDSIPMLNDYTEKKAIASYSNDDKYGVSHKHVIYVNEAGNGYSDWVLGHGHEIVDNEVQPVRRSRYNPETETREEIIGHKHNISDESVKKDVLSDAFDTSVELKDSEDTNIFSTYDREQMLYVVSRMFYYEDGLPESIVTMAKERLNDIGCTVTDKVFAVQKTVADLLEHF